MKHISYIIIIYLILIVSCKKKENTDTIQGNVTNISGNLPVSNGTVEIQAKVISNGSYSTIYSTLATGATNNEGNYEIKFDKVKAANYKIIFRKMGYMTIEEEFFSDELSSGQVTKNITTAQESWLKIIVRNVFPINSEESISFRLINLPNKIPTSCDNLMRTFYGAAYDSIYSCTLPGNYNLVIEKTYNYGNNHILSYDTVNTPTSDTLNYILNF